MNKQLSKKSKGKAQANVQQFSNNNNYNNKTNNKRNKARRRRQIRLARTSSEGVFSDLGQGFDNAVDDAASGIIGAMSLAKRKHSRETKNHLSSEMHDSTGLSMGYAPAASGFVWHGQDHAANVVKITHREVIDSTVNMSEGYTIENTYNVNPGNAATFPWLATIARRFESFRFHKLQFNYTPSCASDTTGLVCLYYDPDPEDSVPPSLEFALNAATVSASAAWMGNTFSVPARMLSAKGTNAKFTEIDDSAAVDYNKTLGRLHLITAGGAPLIGDVGILSVSYSVSLRIPQMHTQTSSEGYLHLYKDDVGDADYLSGADVTDDSNLNYAGVTWNGTSITFPQGVSGKYICVVQVSGTAVSWDSDATILPLTSGSFHAAFEDGAGGDSAEVESNGSNAFTALIRMFDFHLTGTEQTVLNLGLLVGTAINGCDALIFQLPSSHPTSLIDQCCERSRERKIRHIKTVFPDAETVKGMLGDCPSDIHATNILLDKILTPGKFQKPEKETKEEGDEYVDLRLTPRSRRGER